MILTYLTLSKLVIFHKLGKYILSFSLIKAINTKFSQKNSRNLTKISFMSHSHDHAHSHVPALDLNSKKLRNAFYIGIFLNSAFVIIEAAVGWSQNSLALLSDAGHNLSDVVSLILALIAFKLMYSKGYTILYLRLQESDGFGGFA